MLASALIRSAELFAVVLAAGTVVLAAGLWWLRRRRLPLSTHATDEIRDLMEAAGQVRDAAASAAASTARPAARHLAQDARREAQALAAGIAAAGLGGEGR